MQNIGGQAVIEGVMMKSPHGWTIAVRSPKGEIISKTEKSKQTHSFFKLPFIRGNFALLQSLIIGIKAIEFSSNIAYQEENKKLLSIWWIALSIVIAICLTILLFKFLPLWLTTILGNNFKNIMQNSILFNTIDGIIRVLIFLLYVYTIGMWKEMKRIFAYHGAEHMVINTFEAKEELTVSNAKKYKPYHPRCGTSFLLIVMIISISLFVFIPQIWSFTEKLLARIILIPAIAGFSYEILKLTAKFKTNLFMRLLIMPGLLLQKFTVKEPDDSQIEIAIFALKGTLSIVSSDKV